MHFLYLRSGVKHTLESTRTTAYKTGILKHLLYSEVFAHPLNQDEMLRFSGVSDPISYENLHTILADLHSEGLIFLHDNHACLFEVADKVERRNIAAEIIYEEKMKFKVSNISYLFPMNPQGLKIC